MTFTIRGLGTAVPPTQVSHDDSQRLAHAFATPTEEQATWLGAMYHGTGIDARNVFFGADVVRDVFDGTTHSGSVFLPKGTPEDRGPSTGQRMQHYTEEAPQIAVRAVRAALEKADMPASRLTQLVTVSCTGFAAPGFDIELIDQLALPRGIERTHVGFMGCHGALNGLRVARAFTEADPQARVLLCAAELCSLHYYYGWDPQKMIANALFADGAAAIIGSADADSPANDWRVTASASYVFPDSKTAMTWTIGDNGFAMTLSRRVPELIGEHLRPWLSAWLAQHRLTVRDIGSWAVHPGGPKILDAVESALSLDDQALTHSRAVLRDHGNMSSPTVLFILEHMMECDAARPCMALGFGPGLTLEAALLH